MSGLGNTKNNFFARLMGKTSRDKSVYPQQEVPYNPTPQGGSPSGFVPQFLPNYVGGQPQGAPSQPAVTAGSQPTQPSLPQTQAGQPNQQSGTAGAPNSRYRLMQMIEPKPERDQEGMDVIQRRAKINAIGQGFSALAGLGGMAMGGDAPAQTDIVTPFNMQQIQVMDADYRNRLQDWVNRSFQVEAANNQTLNREVDQTIDAENAMERVKLQGENARQLAEQRAQAALQQLITKSEVEQMKAMEAMGIDPNDPKAYEKYLNAQRQKFNTDLNYTKARTNWNNRTPSSGSNTKRTFTPEELAQYQKSRDAAIAAEQAKLEGLNPYRDAEKIKLINERIKQLQTVNPGANELTDMEMLNNQQSQAGGASIGAKGYDPEKMPLADDYLNWDTSGQGQSDQSDQSAPAQIKMPKIDPSLPTEQRQSIVQQMGKRITDNVNVLSGDEPDLELAEQIAQEWVNAGLYDNIEDAWNMVFILAQEASNQ